jgi:hypothetical protein
LRTADKRLSQRFSRIVCAIRLCWRSAAMRWARFCARVVVRSRIIAVLLPQRSVAFRLGAGASPVAIAQGEPEHAERDAHDALAIAASMQAYVGIPDTFECLADLAKHAGSHREAARLFGAAHAIRQRIGAVRFKVWHTGYEASVAAVRDALGEQDFDAAWDGDAALSTEEAIAYAQRGR